jgi:peptidoglycan/LPS O-acetylase OafA/YrhL/lysophospholipase L1-like esterase
VRGLAVCAVLAFHGGYLHGGYLGVDLFFTLSGFLITRLIIDDLVRDRFSLREFWGRRARRLLPACWVLIAAVLLAGPVLVRPTELATLRGDAFATLGYVANWWQVVTSSSYFALFTTPSPLQHTWSLAIEEQLYVLWPLLLIVVWRVGRRRIGLLAVAAAVLASLSLVEAALLYSSVDDGARVYYGTDTRAASVLIGALAAITVWRFGGVLSRWRAGSVVAWAGIATIGIAWVRGNSGRWLYEGGLGGLAVLAAVVLAVVTTQPLGRLHRTLSIRPFIAIGVISYGVYLYHWPLFLWLSPERTHLDGLTLFGLRLVVTFAAATASYFLIERPYRRRRWAFSWRALGGVAAAGVIVLAAIALPSPKRLDRQQTAAAVQTIAASANANANGSAGANASATTTATTSGSAAAPPLVLPVTLRPPHRLLVVGDSVSQRLGPGFDHETPGDVTVVDGGMTFCGAGEAWPQVSVAGNHIKDRCADWRTRWTSQAAQMNADGVMILFGADTMTRRIDGVYRQSCDPVYDAWLQTAFADMLTTMAAYGPVWLVLPPYDRVYNVEQPFEDRDAHTDCTIRDFRAAVAAAAPNAALVDLHGFVCPNGPSCVEDVSGIPLRPDGLHFDGAGADIVARWLLSQVGIRFDPSG